MKRIHVAAAAIVVAEQVLLGRRHPHAHQGGKWEFPGGKVEAGEQVYEALVRELSEELDITARCFRPLIRVLHGYDDLEVLLDVWLVEAFDGEPKGLEGQEVRWFALEKLDSLVFPEANLPVLKALRLPALACWDGNGLLTPALALRAVGSDAVASSHGRGLLMDVLRQLGEDEYDGIDFVVAGVPIGLGGMPDWPRFRELTDLLKVPVFVNPIRTLSVQTAWAHGAQGIVI